jgi:SOS-response transcriptional repressor LexA
MEWWGRQIAVARYVHDQVEATGNVPRADEIGRAVGVSAAYARRMALDLERRGIIPPCPRKTRRPETSPRKPRALTRHQLGLLGLIRDAVTADGRMPTQRALGIAMGTTRQYAGRSVRVLERRGLIKRTIEFPDTHAGLESPDKIAA